ncbi:hypothetical protein STEG23_007464 [Scotinomys teguina]
MLYGFQKNLFMEKYCISGSLVLNLLVTGRSSCQLCFITIHSPDNLCYPCKYYQTIGNHVSYYKDAVRFLGCVNIKDLPVSEQQERAFTLGLAGLLGEGFFNFGELLMHPVLESLRSTNRQWLIGILYAFNSGDVARFQTLKSAWGQQPDPASEEDPVAVP